MCARAVWLGCIGHLLLSQLDLAHFNSSFFYDAAIFSAFCLPRCCHSSTMAKPRVVKDSGLKACTISDGDITKLLSKISEMEASQKALVEKVDFISHKLLETAGKPNSIAKRIANELIASKQQAKPTLMSPPDEGTHAPLATNQRIPITPPNSGDIRLLKTVTEGLLKQLGTTCHCQPCRTWFLHVAKESRSSFQCSCCEREEVVKDHDASEEEKTVPEFDLSFSSNRVRSRSFLPPPSWKCKCPISGASDNEI